jgi:hypothetical protein
LNVNLIHIRANKQADCRVFIVCLQQFINGIHVIIQLASKLGFKWLGFQFTNDVAAQTNVIKQQVNLARTTTDNKFLLSTKKGEACS